MKRYILIITYLVKHSISFGQHNNSTNFINIPPNPTSQGIENEGLLMGEMNEIL
ncbi:hypothetical protein [Sphingobacterium daejeonense]|uniref:hypothetical protein n=1 Tax=Sphingobacterium daejeonense TaxID=371142 RepID=UPI003D311011